MDENDAIQILKKNDRLMKILDSAEKLQLTNWYLVAGCVFQTLWNNQEKLPLMSGLHDIDLVYHDPTLALASSLIQDKKIENVLSQEFNLTFDVHNEAYMHVWKGRKIAPYQSTENAIERFIATVHAIGITKNAKQITLFAPFGLDDIEHRLIRPIYHPDNSKELYETKVKKWQPRFNHLTIEQWQDQRNFIDKANKS